MEEPEELKRRRSPYQYSADEIGEALALVEHYGGNVLRASRELGIPRVTVLYWRDNGEKLPGGVNIVRLRKKEEFAQLADEAAEWVITSLKQEDIDKAGLRDKSIAYGVFRDKAAQDRGEATQVTEHRVTVAVVTTYRRLLELGRPEDEAKRIIGHRFHLGPADLEELERRKDEIVDASAPAGI